MSTSERERCDALSVLSADERDRYCRFVFDEDRRDFAFAHALLRRTLSSAGSQPPHGWRFETSDGGKPRVAGAAATDTDLSFNISHTRGLVACVVGRGVDVGIDVERVSVDLDFAQIANSCFAPIERASLTAVSDLERPGRFIEVWTLKEAWLKAIGVGLTVDLDAFGFSIESSALVFHPPSGVSADDWRFALLEPSVGFRLAVAIRWTGGPVIRMEVQEDANECQMTLRGTRGISVEGGPPRRQPW